ncbi:MAG: Mandelate racemase/muconate lactonizing protein [Segetibacter sp.]|nr:Mandelate racemase/muconate lactonizing protein [Segetibacter sp.]
MKITHIDIFRFSIRMEPFVIATGTMHFAQNVFIRIHTDEGFYGVGECSAFPMIVGETQETCLAMAKDFAQIWKGKDPLAISDRVKELNDYAARNSTAKSAFDMALYDIASKAANQPLYKFLGGSKRSIETDMTIGIASPEEMAEHAVMFEQQGASILKIKLGKKVGDDLERIRLIRKSVKPAMKIRLDANQGWSYEDATYALQEMQELNIEFCEQPMRTWYDDLLPQLCTNSPIAIMADESCYNQHDARRLIGAKACHSINIKFAKSGGITEAIKIHDTAKEAGMPCMIGSMLESRLALTANLHFAYASPNVQFFDLDTCLLGQLEDPVLGGVTYKGFFLDLPDAPGIGADVDEAFLGKCDHWRI